jgi:hypothetical protein
VHVSPDVRLMLPDVRLMSVVYFIPMFACQASLLCDLCLNANVLFHVAVKAFSQHYHQGW